MTYMIQTFDIIGAGRPDHTPSMTAEIQAKVYNAEVGTIFRSTDGAGVGANQWQLLSSGWTLTQADTGNLIIKGDPATGGALTQTTPTAIDTYGFIIRRINNEITITLDNWSGARIILPEGFRPLAWTQVSVVSDHVSWKRLSGGAAVINFWRYLLNNKDDLQRAVGAIEISTNHEMYLYRSGERAGEVATAQWGLRDLWFKNQNWGDADKEKNQGRGGISHTFKFNTPEPFPLNLPPTV